VRRVGLIVVVIALAGMGAAIAGSRAEGSSSARFDVIFDDARGLIGGQLVKVAGARAGTIQNVTVTPRFKARVEATIDSRFVPFHQDATCTIRPEGLIAENYIDCDPGTADSPVLRSVGGQPPTVPVTHTTEPVSLLDLFNIFNAPTRERFTVLVNELGIGTAGRGQDINDILRRANPTLALARRVIGILARQKAQLATIVDATSAIAAEGASHTANLQRFLDSAAALTSITASHSSNISRSIQLLPGLLDAAQPALQQLDIVAKDGTPLVQQLGAAAPALGRVQHDLVPFAAAAKPALASLSTTLKVGTKALRDVTPLVTTVLKYTQASLPSTQLFATLASNLQQHGFVENFLSVTYYITAALARFDGISHLLSILLIGPNNGLCGSFATKPVAGCSAHYGSQPAFKPVNASADTSRRATGPATCAEAAACAARGTSQRTPSPQGASAGPKQLNSTPASASAGAASGAAPQSSSVTPSSGTSASGTPSAGTPSSGTTATGGAGGTQSASQSLQSLVQYLLK
jgi:ABC-type transporter Mla subunit MlaD